MTALHASAQVIRIAAAVVLDEQGRVLLVRKRGTEIFMLPGGKLADGEFASDALARELQEELGCGAVGSPRALGRFTAVAANEPDSIVEAELFAVDLDGPVTPAAEIAEAVWYDHDTAQAVSIAPLTREHVLPMLRGWRRV